MKLYDQVQAISKFVEDLEDREVALLEARMRPLAYSTSGFLGPRESLRSVAQDDLQALQRIGVSPDQLGATLKRFMLGGYREGTRTLLRRVGLNPEQWRETIERYLEHDAEAEDRIREELLKRWSIRSRDPQYDDPMTQLGQWRVRFESYYGFQACPFGPEWAPSLEPCSLTDTEVFAERADSDEELFFSGLLPHLIQAHHFFEGREVPDRLDPVKAARFFRLGRFAEFRSGTG